MNIRNVLLIILGTVVVSVTTALVTVRMVQPNLASSNPKPVEQSAEQGAVAPTSTMIKLSPTAQVPPPPPPVTPTPVPAAKLAGNDTQTSLGMEALIPPKEFDPNYDSRKPLRPDDVVKTLLKKTPACEEDYKELCTGNRFMAEHPLACLRSNKEKISRACANQVGAVQDKFRADCSSDIQKFCSEQRRYFSCLKAKFNELSQSCQANIKESSRK
ncbi:hypothetical protein AZI87_16905 [Bdellovibrio bacteriovorus]|uniref:Uncharacterized protein n=1 Tax=Bdellovibrio bacteriovorus TaxID=959 RepID=A0A162G0D2_BDEBC|nr:hypothetical protein [Bdellovibrio bacteriovorus]KYG62940.1 hypothetical protein AZI87_16905 [Bdellovibrio bacteriovorus]